MTCIHIHIVVSIYLCNTDLSTTAPPATLSTGATIGIAVGVVIGVIVAAVVIILAICYFCGLRCSCSVYFQKPTISM